MESRYPIGTAGQPWNDADKKAWFETQVIQRSYQQDVLDRVESFDDSVEVLAYGSLTIDPARYRLVAVRLPASQAGAPWALITGGVHGYETSGVHGALRFIETAAEAYRDHLNLLVAPCVSPWAYEVVNRWNPKALDPNRSFIADSPCEESAALMRLIDDVGVDYLAHLDLHETTDSDESEFRPALAARDGQTYAPDVIPDGFYTVGDSDNPQPEFQAAIIAGVESVTHIAEPDDDGQIIGSAMTQPGVINYPVSDLGLCAGVTDAHYTTTTEVYPDSPRTTPELCIQAQVAAVRAGLDFALRA